MLHAYIILYIYTLMYTYLSIDMYIWMHTYIYHIHIYIYIDVRSSDSYRCKFHASIASDVCPNNHGILMAVLIAFAMSNLPLWEMTALSRAYSRPRDWPFNQALNHHSRMVRRGLRVSPRNTERHEPQRKRI